MTTFPSERSTDTVPATAETLLTAGRLIREGGLVAFPTETVYGLGADATDADAVARLFAAKARPRFNPLIIHVLDLGHAARLVEVDERARILAARFWPGALSLVLPRRADCPVALLAGAGLETLAVRAPDHEVARALLKLSARPIAAPSANRSGEVSPTTAAHVAASLGDEVDLILDGGACPLGVESTILDLTRDPPEILRHGGVTEEALAAVVGKLAGGHTGGARPRSPGRLPSHYATRLALRSGATTVRPGEALLSFGSHAITGAAAERNLSATGDLTEAAANLFAMLRDLDRPEYTGIAAAAVPDEGLGRAINDRLRRAAAPRATDDRDTA
jgi:L-threonylcarbamoyladenylate synthase